MTVSFLRSLTLMALLGASLLPAGLAQPTDNTTPDEVERWRKAVVHLESTFVLFNQAPKDSVARAGAQITRATKRATAVMVTHEGRRYLVTARHAIYYQIETSTPQVENESRASFIYSMPSLDYVLDGGGIDGWTADGGSQPFPPLLMPGPGTTIYPDSGESISYADFPLHEKTEPYLEEDIRFDLVIISLDRPDWVEFADFLEKQGHVPVSLDDIAAGPSRVGASIMAVGFPDNISVLVDLPDIRNSTGLISENGQLPFSPVQASLPTTSFGHVALLHERLDQFYADVSVYPGNSGGLVVEDGKLVGIVTKQASVNLDGAVGKARIPFALVVKGEHVRDAIIRLHDQVKTVLADIDEP